MIKINFKKIILDFILPLLVGFIVGLFLFPPSFPDLHKPAIYFYPMQKTEISLKLDKSINITLDIPKYSKQTGWNMIANTDGYLTDLQSKLTDCNSINPNQLGLEYALKACKQNKYPYIYWEGSNPTRVIPSSKEGWIINKSNLKDFLSKKLDNIGFSNREKQDFLLYWIPKTSQLNQDRFFIYFLQNESVDNYFTEIITPKPNFNNRIYMVIKTRSMPKEPVIPQKLKKFTRKSFYVVDWGGIIL